MILVSETWQLMESSQFVISCHGISKNGRRKSKAIKTFHIFFNTKWKLKSSTKQNFHIVARERRWEREEREYE